MDDIRNKTFIGVVADNKDPRKLGRCRVRVVNIFDKIPTEDIPWATPWRDLNGNTFNVPEVGKLVTVVFDQGNVYKPEFIYAEHFNRNLEDKLQTLSGDNYLSMKSLIYDHKTQIYVNDNEGLKIDYLYNNINIEKDTISLNLKDNNSNLNLGDAQASQQVILGNHFMDWFDEFLEILTTTPYMDSQGGPIMIHPLLIDHFKVKYMELRDPVFLSHHVRVVDNNAVNTVKNTSDSFPVHRQNFGQLGDILKSFDKLYNLAKRIKDAPRPWKKRKKRFDAKYKPPQQVKPMGSSGTQNNRSDTSGSPTTNQSGAQSSDPIQNINNPDNSRPADGIGNTNNSPANSKDYSKIDPARQIEFYEEEDEMTKLLNYLDTKSGGSPISGKTEDYVVFEDPYVLNIVAFRNRLHEYGTITNRFDDQLWVFYKNEKNQWEQIRKYSVTTMPGYKVVDGKKVDPPVLPENVGFINYGQYINSYKLGYHNVDDYGKRHPALICDKVGIRLNKKRGQPSLDRYVNTTINTQIGENVDGWLYDTGMNIHLAMSTDESVFGTTNFPKAGQVFDEVNNWSMGCIVFNNPGQYREFIGLCEEQRSKAKKSQFSLIVAPYREYELFDTELDFGDENTTMIDDNIEDRFSDFDEDTGT